MNYREQKSKVQKSKHQPLKQREEFQSLETEDYHQYIKHVKQ